MLDRIKTLLTPDVSLDAKVKGVSLFIGKVLDKFDGRLVSLEARQLQKGDKGDRGERGEPGKDGRDGKDGKDGRDGAPGPKGAKGDAGPVGKAGSQGVSIVDAEVALDGNLVLKLSNGKIIDAGEIVQPDSKISQTFLKQLSNYQIVVSSTAPPSPQVNDLWYDIS